MTVKEVEKLIGITSSNIRFYEKEQLLAPARNSNNNYRQYSQEDIDRLQKIKFLRTLGVSVLEIKKIIDGDSELSAVIEERKEQILKEEVTLQQLQNICEGILEHQMEFQSLDTTLLDEESKDIQHRMKVVLSEDTSETEVSPKEFNKNIWKWLIGGYLFDTCICLLGAWIIYMVSQNSGNPVDTTGFIHAHDNIIFAIVCIVTVFTAVSIIWTAKMGVLYMNFILAVSILPVFILLVYSWICPDAVLDLVSIGVFLGEMALSVLIFGTLINQFDNVKQNCIYGILFSILFSGVLTVMNYNLFDDWVFWSVCLFINTLYISLRWILGNIDHTDYSKYMGIIIAIGMINVLGSLISGNGHTRSWWRGRDEVI